jgi:DNA-binding transcriptional LysR family regulator
LTDRLSGISIFVRAAGAGSFARAAGQLGVTRSAVGKSIARLEERLRTRLFHRTTRGQSLTERGEEFYARCLVIMAELDAAEAALDADNSGLSGSLRVSAPVLLGRQCVAPILVAFARQHPKLELDLRFSDHLVDLVEERIDLAVRIGPLPDRAGQIARRLGSFDMVVCAAPDYLAARGVPARPEDLSEHHCLFFSRRGGRLEPWRFERSDGSTIEIVTAGRIRFDDLDAIADAAVAGAGLACLPTWLVKKRIKNGALVAILTGYRAIGNDVYAVRSRSRHVPSKVRVATGELAGRMPDVLCAGYGDTPARASATVANERVLP